MARFYASFDNSTVAALEAGTSDNFYERVAISNGSTLKAALISTRSALSSAALAQMDAGNRDGSLGIVVPTDAVTRAGGNYSWSNLYTNTGAVWPSDPRVRPTAPILISGSTAVSPTDAGSITESLYTDAQTAVENVLAAMTGGGPRGRIGLNPYRTLASIWHDHDLSFFAWDDFTPGAVQTLSVSGLGSAGSYEATASWLNYQYANDENPSGAVRVLIGLSGPATYTFDSDWITPPVGKAVTWTLSSPAPIAGTYTLEANVRVRDAVISTHVGAQTNATPVTVTIF